MALVAFLVRFRIIVEISCAPVVLGAPGLHIPDLHDPLDASVALDRPHLPVRVLELDPIPVHAYVPLRELDLGHAFSNDRDGVVVDGILHGPESHTCLCIMSISLIQPLGQRLPGHEHVRLGPLDGDDALDREFDP
ncbi:uncharacterized protein FMAN_15247 [Fusarium mangiferae]|uniref:Secreted protein n=1 Tax=Fusarium mangiferae TaxID=192010 RepID=A0A1L7UFG7_FUSMA|nr:uncharacterized protein FMAN_15247 [Fusarium mangiferae]CVL07073.1 uncharacterized protein FMAN_15247 [Fusarium mangiferae]